MLPPEPVWGQVAKTAVRTDGVVMMKPGLDHDGNTEGALDFVPGWMASQHEGCVSTMLTESGLSIGLAVRDFKGRWDEMEGARR